MRLGATTTATPPFGKGGWGGLRSGPDQTTPGQVSPGPLLGKGVSLRDRSRGIATLALSSPVLALSLLSAPLPASADPWATTWDAALYAYPEIRGLADDSVLNPGNLIARLPETLVTGEARLNLRAESRTFRLALRPILSVQDTSRDSHREAYLAQWQARALLDDAWAVSLGREVFNWGPAQFRSPSSPFYFDNARSNPLRELSGVDAAKLAWTPSRQGSASLAYVRDRGHDATAADPWRDTWLMKADLRGDDWAAGLALVQPTVGGLFAGAHLQKTLDEAWLVYGELSSSTRANVLVSPANSALPFSLAIESPRRATGLVGATRTFENGHSLTLEYLHDGHGYSHAESRAFFARAASGLPAAGLALANTPRLLNRNYLHVVLQSNLLEGDDYWRLMLSRNLDDGSHQWAGYGEHAVNGHLSLFALASLHTGGPRRESASLLERSLTLGLRLALP